MRGSLAKVAPALPLGVQRRCARLRDNTQRSVSGVTHRRLRRDATHAFHGRAGSLLQITAASPGRATGAIFNRSVRLWLGHLILPSPLNMDARVEI
eukprot:scaffold1792_cov124-Isochrysis_galbana.AAC.5